MLRQAKASICTAEAAITAAVDISNYAGNMSNNSNHAGSSCLSKATEYATPVTAYAASKKRT